jgi:RNA polymerase sigma-70 factor (ECF subfamily)
LNATTAEAMNEVFRAEVGLICGSLVRITGDFDLAEDLVQDAVVAALQRWPLDGVPERPAAWLLQTARRRAIDRLRRDATYRSKLQLLTDGWAPDVRSDPDDRLRLIFICCHPALARDAQVALTLRAVMGMTTSQIAHAFLVSEATMAQRIVRAKRKIVGARIPYRVPEPEELPDRLAEVLASLYIVFNEGYLGSGPDVATSRDLCVDALWLCELLARMLPEESEVLALLALMRLHESRRATRFAADGRLVLLKDQDRSRWDHAAIAEAGGLLEEARRLGRPGSYWLQAAIAACHAEAPTFEETDWPQILALYGALTRLNPGPVVRLNRAIALEHVAGPVPAMEELDSLRAELDGYHLYWATRAELLRRFGRLDEATDADRRAIELTDNPSERALLETRLEPPGIRATGANNN